MTREEAFKKAVDRFGDRAIVGEGRPISTWTMDDSFYVGWKETGVWQWLGIGATWEEAFENVKKVKTHVRDKLEFYK